MDAASVTVTSIANGPVSMANGLSPVSTSSAGDVVLHNGHDDVMAVPAAQAQPRPSPTSTKSATASDVTAAKTVDGEMLSKTSPVTPSRSSVEAKAVGQKDAAVNGSTGADEPPVPEIDHKLPGGLAGPPVDAPKLFVDITEKRITCTGCKALIQVNQLGSCGRHPEFKVLLCKNCFQYLIDPEWTIDPDGFYEECYWCGQGGNLCLCDSCKKSICKGCIRRNFDRKEATEMLDAPVWTCFACNDEPIRNLQQMADAIFWQYYHSFKKTKKRRTSKAQDSASGTGSVTSKKRRRNSGESDVSSVKRRKVSKNNQPGGAATPVLERVVSEGGTQRIIVINPSDVLGGSGDQSLDGSEASLPVGASAETSGRKEKKVKSEKEGKKKSGEPGKLVQQKLKAAPPAGETSAVEAKLPVKFLDLVKVLRTSNTSYANFLSELEKQVSTSSADPDKTQILLISEMEQAADDLLQTLRANAASLNAAVQHMSKSGVVIDIDRRNRTRRPSSSPSKPSRDQSISPAKGPSKKAAPAPSEPPAPTAAPSRASLQTPSSGKKKKEASSSSKPCPASKKKSVPATVSVSDDESKS